MASRLAFASRFPSRNFFQASSRTAAESTPFSLQNWHSSLDNRSRSNARVTRTKQTIGVHATRQWNRPSAHTDFSSTSEQAAKPLRYPMHHAAAARLDVTLAAPHAPHSACSRNARSNFRLAPKMLHLLRGTTSCAFSGTVSIRRKRRFQIHSEGNGQSASKPRFKRRAVSERVTIVTGSKGGVGTSTVALNLAVQLAMQTKKRTALIDLARPFGQISLMLDFEPRFTILDALERIGRIDGNTLASMATRHKSRVEILAGPLQVPMKPEQRQSVTIEAILRLIQIAESIYDFVLVDLGVVNAADWALVLQEAHTILLVAEPSLLALGMIERHMASAARAAIDCQRIQIVANRWRQNDDEALAAFEKNSGRTILTRLPNDYRQLTEAAQLAMPLMGSGGNPLIARYRELAAWLASSAQAASKEEGIAKIAP